MPISNKMVAAMASAIGLYMEAEAQLAASNVLETGGLTDVPKTLFSPWAMAGRQAMMDLRRLYQMRLVR